ncbi:MAG: prepilin-type N-terminal cleavage/methylation domain-containing protein, partial [Magnetococcales bacterium]|nr:prepilin-type N-terminal cleavage/methylation domain-containing protein [Magnetococcales bacterium]
MIHRPHSEKDRPMDPDPATGKRGGHGFSLVEISIVLVILGVVLGSATLTMTHMREKQQREKSNFSLVAIEEALISHAIINGRLPCPDVGVDASDNPQADYDGFEDRDGGGSCRSPYGVLPWSDLGLTPSPYKDPWTHYFSYHADPNFTNATVNCSTTDNLNLTVQDPSGAVMGSGLPAIVVSHGHNQDGRITPAPQGPTGYIQRDNLGIADSGENENADDDATFVTVAGDDILLYLTPMKLKSRMLAAQSQYCLTTTTITTSVPTTTSVATTTTSVATTTTSVPT